LGLSHGLEPRNVKLWVAQRPTRDLKSQDGFLQCDSGHERIEDHVNQSLRNARVNSVAEINKASTKREIPPGEVGDFEAGGAGCDFM
jgi:hypothetical protein